jgi:hypothetical protein
MLKILDIREYYCSVTVAILVFIKHPVAIRTYQTDLNFQATSQQDVVSSITGLSRIKRQNGQSDLIM